ncbi:Alpha/beta hydrolase [uncultured virus]|nr:Alpha/beta hydrolase [uncultured virus]
MCHRLEKTTQAFIDSIVNSGAPPIYTLSVEEARQVLEDLQSQPVHKEKAKIKDLVIGEDISIRIIKPYKYNKEEPLPMILYMHGGGWILGSKNTHDRLVRQIANGTHSAVIFVDYSRSPEARYPVAINEGYFTLKYFYKHAAKYGLDPNRIALMGDSVGGNMTIEIAMKAHRECGPKILYQVLFYPVTDADFNTGSYREFADGPWLTRAAMKWFWDAYLPNKSKRESPKVSPLNYSLNQLSNLPPTLLMTVDNDVLRDEGEAFGYKIMCAGVDTTAVRYMGTIHDFVMLNPLSETPAAKSAILLANTTVYNIFWPCATKNTVECKECKSCKKC